MSSDCVKVVLVGEAAAGKSALAQRLGYDSFSPHTLPTIGIDFIRVRRPAYRMHLWDTAGQERYRSIISSYYRIGEVLVAVVDSTEEEQEQEQALDYWRQQCAEHNPDGLFAVVATKADLPPAQDQTEEGRVQAWCEERGVPYFLTSACTGECIEEAFAELVRLHRERHPPPERTAERRHLGEGYVMEEALGRGGERCGGLASRCCGGR